MRCDAAPWLLRTMATRFGASLENMIVEYAGMQSLNINNNTSQLASARVPTTSNLFIMESPAAFGRLKLRLMGNVMYDKALEATQKHNCVFEVPSSCLLHLPYLLLEFVLISDLFYWA